MRGCAPTGPTLAVVSVCPCRAPTRMSITHRNSRGAARHGSLESPLGWVKPLAFRRSLQEAEGPAADIEPQRRLDGRMPCWGHQVSRRQSLQRRGAGIPRLQAREVNVNWAVDTV